MTGIPVLAALWIMGSLAALVGYVVGRIVLAEPPAAVLFGGQREPASSRTSTVPNVTKGIPGSGRFSRAFSGNPSRPARAGAPSSRTARYLDGGARNGGAGSSSGRAGPPSQPEQVTRECELSSTTPTDVEGAPGSARTSFGHFDREQDQEFTVWVPAGGVITWGTR